MTTIRTIIPIAMDDLRQIITTPDATAVVDYGNSRLKSRAALIYATNVNLTQLEFDVTNASSEDVFALVDSYITLKSILDVRGLVFAVGIILRHIAGAPVTEQSVIDVSVIKPDQVEAYLADPARKANADNLFSLMSNLTTFTVTCYGAFKEKYGKGEDVFPVVNDIDFTGCTFVNLLQYDWFMLDFFANANGLLSPVYYVQHFDEYVYGGRNLFSYVKDTFLLAALETVLSDTETFKLMLNYTPSDFEEVAA
jgi:hypothetical protein